MQSLPRFYNPIRNQWYVATRLLGQGGQGTVWAGTCGGMPVAIKVQSDFKAWDLEQSIHLMCIGHEFIVTAYDRFMAQDGLLILVMEQAEGNAQELINTGARFTAKQICRIGADLASALETLHAVVRLVPARPGAAEHAAWPSCHSARLHAGANVGRDHERGPAPDCGKSDCDSWGNSADYPQHASAHPKSAPHVCDSG